MSKITGKVIWITGLSGAGKTSLAKLLTFRLRQAGESVIMLDGDSIRELIANDETAHFSRAARLKNALLYAKLCKLISSQGHTVVMATISMFQEIYDWNRKNQGRYFEVYLKTTLPELRRRDKNHIYSHFEAGKIKNVAGLDIEIDEPTKADWTMISDDTSSKALSRLLMDKLKEKNFI